MRSLKIDEQLVMNKYAKVAVQSTNTEQAQQNQTNRGCTNFPSTSTALILSPEKPSSTSSRAQKTVKDTHSEGLLQTLKENGQRKKPNEKKKQQKKKTPNRTKRAVTVQILQ